MSKTILIIGSTDGIGLEMAKTLDRKGHSVPYLQKKFIHASYKTIRKI